MLASPSCPAPGAAEAPRPRRAAGRAWRQGILGASVCFHSDSEALMKLAVAAYEGLPPHQFAGTARDIDIDLQLVPGASSWRDEPPPVRTRLDAGLLYGVLDDRNFVLASPERRRARVVACEGMLDWPYHLRYELIEFAVFLLAARCQDLVPLHAACIARDGRGVLVLGASGAGKSTLALHALLGGLAFVAEDAVFVDPASLLATGVANYLHVHADAVAAVVDPAARDWIARSPVIRRRSGACKLEADLRLAPQPAQLAPAPVRLVGAVVLSGRPAADSAALLEPVPREQVAACLAIDQAHARTRPGWPRFESAIARAGLHYLHRGSLPRSQVDALRRLLD